MLSIQLYDRSLHRHLSTGDNRRLRPGFYFCFHAGIDRRVHPISLRLITLPVRHKRRLPAGHRSFLIRSDLNIFPGQLDRPVFFHLDLRIATGKNDRFAGRYLDITAPVYQQVVTLGISHMYPPVLVIHDDQVTASGLYGLYIILLIAIIRLGVPVVYRSDHERLGRTVIFEPDHHLLPYFRYKERTFAVAAMSAGDPQPRGFFIVAHPMEPDPNTPKPASIMVVSDNGALPLAIAFLVRSHRRHLITTRYGHQIVRIITLAITIMVDRHDRKIAVSLMPINIYVRPLDIRDSPYLSHRHPTDPIQPDHI